MFKCCTMIVYTLRLLYNSGTQEIHYYVMRLQIPHHKEQIS
jgi:hypothetical protein